MVRGTHARERHAQLSAALPPCTPGLPPKLTSPTISPLSPPSAGPLSPVPPCPPSQRISG
eukprot:scaffold99151_cov66-Phaeocystis_antarctica.AAC.5